jgi:hypothetical protein
MDAKEIRLGNKLTDKFYDSFKTIITVDSINEKGVNLNIEDDGNFSELAQHFIVPEYTFDQLFGIPISPEILEKAGFEQHQHFTIQDIWFKNIGRDMVISIACVGTPNEMVFITEEQPPEVKNVIVVRNYDYDGKTYLHHIQNIYQIFTGQELNINL